MASRLLGSTTMPATMLSPVCVLPALRSAFSISSAVYLPPLFLASSCASLRSPGCNCRLFMSALKAVAAPVVPPAAPPMVAAVAPPAKLAMSWAALSLTPAFLSALLARRHRSNRPSRLQNFVPHSRRFVIFVSRWAWLFVALLCCTPA